MRRGVTGPEQRRNPDRRSLDKTSLFQRPAASDLIDNKPRNPWHCACFHGCVMLQRVGVTIENYMTQLSARQQVVASNIANADTPGYKTKDVDFQSELALQMSGIKPTISEVSGLRTKNDGNNVDIDREARLLAENALKFNIASNLARGELLSVRKAIEDGKTS